MCGLAKATVCTIISETCQVIVNTLWKDTVLKYFPTTINEFQQSMEQFAEEL